MRLIMKNKRLLYFLALFAIILLTLVVALSDFLILYTPHYFALTPEEVLAFERATKVDCIVSFAVITACSVSIAFGIHILAKKKVINTEQEVNLIVFPSIVAFISIVIIVIPFFFQGFTKELLLAGIAWIIFITPMIVATLVDRKYNTDNV